MPRPARAAPFRPVSSRRPFWPGAAIAALLALATVFAPASHARARAPRADVPRTAREADALISAHPDAAHRQAVLEWSARAPLEDLVWVLRRPPAELGDLEADLCRAALQSAGKDRVLASRFAARLALANPGAATKLVSLLASALDPRAGDPRASVFRVGLVLPDRGDYADYARTLHAGLAAAIAVANEGSARPIELARWSSGDASAAGAARAADSAAARCGVLVGELLSVNTFPVAAVTHAHGCALISPTATDESVGAVGPAVFQIGPSAGSRGSALARAALAGGSRRFATLVSGDSPAPFAVAFAAAVRAGGGEVVWREVVASGTPDFRAQSRAVARDKIEALLWDGDPREVEALVRQLAKDKLSVRLFGGEALAPDRHHADSRLLLEGAVYVGDDWDLAPPERARLDSLARGAGEQNGGGLFLRGWLAGRTIADAVHSGALTPKALSTALASAAGAEGDPLGRSFLMLERFGARIPIQSIVRGKPQPLR